MTRQKKAALEVIKREILRLKKLLGIATLLLLAATSAQAQRPLIRTHITTIAAPEMPPMPGMPSGSFPNTYNCPSTGITWTPGTKIDPAKGKSPGKVTVTISCGGSTNGGNVMDNSGAHHTPYSYIKMGSLTLPSTHGPQFTPSQNMGWTTSYTAELMDMDCTFAVLESGGCEIDNMPQVQCTTIGFFAIPYEKIQIEFGITISRPTPGTRGTATNRDGYHLWNTDTSLCTNKPDFPGPDILYEGFDDMGTYPDVNAIRTTAFGWRRTAWGLDFENLPWTWMYLPRPGYYTYVDMEPWNFPAAACTNKDMNISPD